MDFNKISPGANVPHDVNVIIEIPAQGDPIKYEIDKESGALFVDRFIGTAMQYPTNYGYIPQTLSTDGDAVDVLVITPVPLIPGAVVRSRPIGMLAMTDESGEDAKILAVPVRKLSQLYDNVTSHSDVAPAILATITHFFEHYKDLEEGKWVTIKGWESVDRAHQEILNSIERYQAEI
jgi:inorganic pyrophosphatase